MKKIILLLVITTIFSCQEKKSISNQNNKVIEITNYLDSLDGFSGAVLIAKKDSVLFKKAYGFAHLGHQIKNRTDTKFNYASIGKSFTSVAILQLIQKGQLSLQDNIGKFLPNYPNKTVRDSVTISHLLTHTSGLPHYFARKTFLDASKDLYRTMDDLKPLYENEPLESNPGEIFSYRNTNYVILGSIIEKISGKTYDTYLKENIFSLANMSNSGNFDLDHPINNAAEGYTLSEVYPNKLKINTHTFPSKGNAAGGGYTNLDDLFKFATALKNNKLLNPDYTNLMKKKPENASYGYGMQFSGARGSGIYGHSGGHFGVGSEWRVFEKQNYTVVLLTNKDADQGFLDARFFIEKSISGSTPKLDNYFFTKETINICLDKGLEKAKTYIKDSKLEFSEYEFTVKGYEMIKRGFYKKAIDIFKLQIFSFPKSYDAYDSLGEAYMLDGQNTKAIENYNKSLELNSENTNAQVKLEELLKR